MPPGRRSPPVPHRPFLFLLVLLPVPEVPSHFPKPELEKTMEVISNPLPIRFFHSLPSILDYFSYSLYRALQN